jgi:Fic family protein
LTKPPKYLRRTNRIKTIHSCLEIEGKTLSFDPVTADFEKKKVLGPPKDIESTL